MAIFIVNSIGDQPDPTPNDGVQDDCDPATPGNQFTLRGAIQTANSKANVGGPDEIRFNIGNAKQTINIVNGELPTIVEAVVIDALPTIALPNQKIRLDGANAGNANGLVIDALGQSTVKGLVITQFLETVPYGYPCPYERLFR